MVLAYSGATPISAQLKSTLAESTRAEQADLQDQPSFKTADEFDVVTALPAVATNFDGQLTLRNRISCTGIGLHSGVNVSMTLLPAEPNSGILFRRLDLAPEVADIPARWDRVCETTMGTSLANDHGTSVATVEHLMAAFAGCGIDNAIVELDSGEVPIMDGSSAPFVFLIECAGAEVQNAPKRKIRITRPITVEDGARKVTLLPADKFSINFEIDFDSAVISHQSFEFDSADMSFKEDLGRARTFGFIEDVNALHERGLARGASMDNVVVVGRESVLNVEGLRFEDEFARHKALDAVGDLYLSGASIVGRYEGVRAGHEMNIMLLKALFADATAWEWVEQTSDKTETMVEEVWQAAPAAAMA